MKSSKPINWKSRALAAEKERDQKIHELEECDHYAKKQYKAYDAELATAKKDVVKLQSLLSEKQHELDYRPTVEVEKEVLPWWVKPIAIVPTLGMFAMFIAGYVFLRRAEQPILSPYAVYITKHSQTDEFQHQALAGLSDAWMNKFHACQDSWREDQAELKLLRRKLKDRQEGTVYVP